MRVAIYQCKPLFNVKKNLKRANNVLTKAKRKKCDLVIFPEMFLTGYPTDDESRKQILSFGNLNLKKLQTMCNNLNIAVVVGLPRVIDKTVFNSSCFIDKTGQIAGIYDKTHLWKDEKKVFNKGCNLDTFQTSLGVVGLLICYDIDFPEASRILALKQADFICCISANMKPYDNIHNTFIKTRALENDIPILYCNYVGKDNYYKYVGQSNVINSQGKPHFHFSRHNKILYADIELDVNKINETNIKDIRSDLYNLI